MSTRIPPPVIIVFGAGTAAGVGYLTAQNPQAQPPGAGVWLRVLIIGAFTAAAAYAQTSTMQKRMGLVLTGAGVFAGLWLLNGSSNRFAFSVGALLSGPALVVAYYVILVHPTGRLRSKREVQSMAVLGGAVVLLWTVATLTSVQPPLRTPLLACMPHCPRNVFYLGVTINHTLPALKDGLRVIWVALTIGTVVLLQRRWRSASGPLRRPLLLLWIVSGVATVLLLAYLGALRSGDDAATNAFATGYLTIWVVIPAAILAGLAGERLFMGQALARFVSDLAADEDADPGALLAARLEHPSLSIAYIRPATGAYVDFSGAPVADPRTLPNREVDWVERHGRPVAVVAYDRELADQRRFIHAAADTAVMQLAQAQLLADLRASTAELTASRLRLVESAQAERQRIERDLHDSVQQDLLALRLRLEVAAEAITDDPVGGQRMLAAVGRQLDDVLNSLRDLARGIYPPLLRDHGFVEAVRSAILRSPVPASVRAVGIGRYSEDVEVAVYFCCLEALQNIAKHAGPDADSAIRFWQDNRSVLRFEIADSGMGFKSDAAELGKGLANMRDRVEAIGGTLAITSRVGEGTVVRGRIPFEVA